ncbi:endo alpha-1,4 polygalactosaminidase [Streptomyces cinnamoneus]|uniref:Endo alpha-1,4 polygalactosaminidase n=1 Tax=Streptomyces cinnamoneus TaxID=53446 RepID=A0A918TFX9_STRCJ|nr:endo alpha-1,4 polygalactosaminidase [Streptomyces cinnamoneus]GHC46272.1 endo alpha-1,4 polygalactosaminidase [Streptomyces cinnamoneus]
MTGRPSRAGLLGALLLVLPFVLAGCSGSSPDEAPGADDERPVDRMSAAPDGSAPPASRRWQPRPGLRWQWQLGGKVDTSVDVPVYDIDGFENSARTVAELHSRGRKVICYINAGAWEDFRPDHSEFPRSVLGKNNKGWDGEKWLDIRRLDALRPIMAARIDMCRQKGFDAVEPDLTEGFRNRTGFALTAADQLAFNRMLVKLAHDRGLAIGLKNDLEQIPELVRDFDFAVNEQCAQYGECEKLTPFVKQNKAVFHVEYDLSPKEFCGTAGRLGLSSMKKKLELDAWRQPC